MQVALPPPHGQCPCTGSAAVRVARDKVARRERKNKNFRRGFNFALNFYRAVFYQPTPCYKSYPHHAPELLMVRAGDG